MKPEMLQSQFAALEEPTDALTLDIREDVENIVEKIIGSFGLNRPEIKEGVSHRDT